MGTKQSERVLLLAPELTERSRQAYLTLSAALYDRGILVVPKEQNVPTAVRYRNERALTTRYDCMHENRLSKMIVR
jgi:hypothetical protein